MVAYSILFHQETGSCCFQEKTMIRIHDEERSQLKEFCSGGWRELKLDARPLPGIFHKKKEAMVENEDLSFPKGGQP
jgi:hypothetical protein